MRRALLIAVLLTACSPDKTEPDSPYRLATPPILALPRTAPIVEVPTTAPAKETPLIVLPPAPSLTARGQNLILEYETGGRGYYNRNPYPEAPDARYSGVTIGIGYDLSTNSPTVAINDWSPSLGVTNAKRLAATHDYTGAKAQAHLYEVRDILVKWEWALGVFAAVDVTRTFTLCRRTFPGFEGLRPNAQAAIISLVFNRGNSMNGANRSEMREIRDLIPNRDYSAIAQQFRVMVRVWKGTSIYNGMKRRREAEAALVETP